MLKKLVGLMISICFLFSVGSCGVKGDEDIYTIEYYVIMNGTSAQGDQAKVQDEINNKLREKIGAEVNMHIISDWSYNDSLNLVINSGDDWDICFTSNWTNNYKRNVAKEAFLDITELLPEYAPSLYNLVDERVYDAIKVYGKIYATQNLQILPRTPGFTVDKTVFNNYLTASGTTVGDIKSISDLTPYLAYCKANCDDYNIISSLDNSGVIVALGYDDIYGTTYPGAVKITDNANDGLTVYNQFAQNDYFEIFKLCGQWFENGYISKDVLTKQFDYTKAFAWLETTWKPGLDGVGTQRAGKETYSFAFGDSVMYNSWLSCCLSGINSESGNPVKCLQFLELLNTDKELCNMFIYGIEGKHYNKVSENRVKVIPDSGYNLSNTSWQFANQFNAYLVDPQEDGVWEETAEINSKASYSPLVGFNFDYSKFELELNNCYSIYNEYMTSFLQGIYGSGSKLTEKYGQFVSKLEKAGANRIIAEMQKQVDAWLANK